MLPCGTPCIISESTPKQRSVRVELTLVVPVFLKKKSLFVCRVSIQGLWIRTRDPLTHSDERRVNAKTVAAIKGPPVGRNRVSL